MGILKWYRVQVYGQACHIRRLVAGSGSPRHSTGFCLLDWRTLCKDSHEQGLGITHHKDRKIVCWV